VRKLLPGKSGSIFIFWRSLTDHDGILANLDTIIQQSHSYMAMKRIVLVVISCSLCLGAIAQQADPGDNSLRPATKPSFPSRKEIQKRERKALKPKTTIDLQQEYYQRVEDVMKARKKTARLMKKPQYSDPMYFGHRRPPKKHSARNMRFCRECGIRH
jgi:hypothetical protein